MFSRIEKKSSPTTPKIISQSFSTGEKHTSCAQSYAHLRSCVTVFPWSFFSFARCFFPRAVSFAPSPSREEGKRTTSLQLENGSHARLGPGGRQAPTAGVRARGCEPASGLTSTRSFVGRRWRRDQAMTRATLAIGTAHGQCSAVCIFVDRQRKRSMHERTMHESMTLFICLIIRLIQLSRNTAGL